MNLRSLKWKIELFRKNDRQKKEELVKVLDEGERLFRLGFFQEAIHHFKFCLRHSGLMQESLIKEAYAYLAFVYKKMGKSIKAERIFLIGLMRYKNDVYLLHRKGLFHIQMCGNNINIKGRLLHYGVALPLNLLMLNRYYYENYHHAKKSFSIFKKLHKEYYENDEYLYYYGVACQINGRIHDGIKAFDEVLRRNHAFPNLAKNSLFDKVKADGIATGEISIGIAEAHHNDTVLLQKRRFITDEEVDKIYDKIIASEEYEHCEKTKLKETKRYKTLRGIFVRSKAETLIDNFYYVNGIKVEYEPYVVGMKDGKVVHARPDFFLPDYNCIHEHVPTEQSKKRFEWKKSIYEDNGYYVMTTDDNDEEDMGESIRGKLKQFEFKNDEKE